MNQEAGRFRWGILGAAAIADGALIPAIKQSETSLAAAIASRRSDRAVEVAGRHGIVRIYDSYEEILTDPDIDGIYVALPNSMHAEWTIRGLESGKHVLCEKPLATTAAEAEKIAESARVSKRNAMEAFMYRFNAETVAFCESAPVPRYVDCAFSFRQTDPRDIRLDRALAGGALMDLGCYAVNIVRWLMGEPDDVTARAHVDGVDRSIAATFRFAGGRMATIWASFDATEVQEVTVIGDDRQARTQHRPFSAWFDPTDGSRLTPYRNMVDAFVRAVRRGEAEPIPLTDSIANLTVMDKIRLSAGI